MTGLLMVWLLSALGGATLGLLGFCLVRNMGRAFFQAASVDAAQTPKEMAAVG